MTEQAHSFNTHKKNYAMCFSTVIEVTYKYFPNQEIIPEFSIYPHQNICIFIITMPPGDSLYIFPLSEWMEFIACTHGKFLWIVWDSGQTFFTLRDLLAFFFLKKSWLGFYSTMTVAPLQHLPNSKYLPSYHISNYWTRNIYYSPLLHWDPTGTQHMVDALPC